MINSLARRSGGGLWFGLAWGSFGFFDGQQFHSLQRTEWGGPFTTVRSVWTKRDGTLLLGGSALAGRLVDTNTLTSLVPANNADVFSVYEDPHGRIWMGTAQDGLFYWEHGRLMPFPDQTLRNMVISADCGGPGRKHLGGDRERIAVLRNQIFSISRRPNSLPSQRRCWWTGTGCCGSELPAVA